MSDPPTIVFLLGAGASREAGLPLTEGLFECLEQSFVHDGQSATDESARRLVEQERQLFQLVRDCMRRAATPSHNPDSFEAVAETVRQLRHFSTVDLAPFVCTWTPELLRFVGHGPDTRTVAERLQDLPVSAASHAAAAHGLWAHSEGQVFDRLWHRIRRGLRAWLARDFRSDQIDYLAALAQIIGERDVFTLNFDLAMECGCVEAGVEFTTGFPERESTNPFGILSKKGFWAPHAFEQRGVLRLHKLHGSIAWHVHRGAGGEIAEYGRDEWRHMHESEEEKLGELSAWMNSRAPFPMMFGNGVKLPRHEPFVTLYARWLRAVAEADVLVTIGWSGQFEPIISDSIFLAIQRKPLGLQLVSVTKSSDEAGDLTCTDGAREAVLSGTLLQKIQDAECRVRWHRSIAEQIHGTHS